MKNKFLRFSCVLLALLISFSVDFSLLSTLAASKKIDIVNDSITKSTLISGDWKKTSEKISYRGSESAALRISGYESSNANNVNAIATLAPVTFSEDEDLMAEYDVLGISSSTVHFGVMQGITLKDSAAWDYNYGYTNTFGWYAGSKNFTFESASANYKFAEEYINGKWEKSQKGKVDFAEDSYRVRQIYRSAAVNDEAAIELWLLPVSENGVYDFESTQARKFRVTAKHIAEAKSNGLASSFNIGDGHVGINVEDVGANSGGSVTLDNVKFSKISSSDTTIKSIIAEANFDNEKLPSNFTGYGENTIKAIDYVRISDLQFESAAVEDLLGFTRPIVFDKSLEDRLFEQSFTVNLKEHSNEFLIGMAFGAIQAAEYTQTDNYSAGIFVRDGSAKLAIVLNEQIIAEKDLTLPADESIKLNYVVKNIGEGNVSLNVSALEKTISASIQLQKLEGYLSIGNFADTPATFYIDDFMISSYAYAEYAGKNISVDFENGMPDSNNWFFSTDSAVRLSGDNVPNPETDARYTANSGVKFEDGIMKFDRTSDGSMFGPKYSYGDWRFSFDLMSYQYEPTFTEVDGNKMYTPGAPWFGFSFAKGSVRSSFAAGSVQSLMMTRRKTTDPAKSELTIFGYHIDAFSSSVVVPVNASVDTPISLRITAKNRNVDVEFKLLQEDSTQWKPVVSFADTETAGYMSFCSTNWTNFSVDNVSVENLDALYDPSNYPDLKINGSERATFDKAAPSDITFNINIGRYNFELLGSKITESDYVIDSTKNTITIKKEFLSKFSEGERNIYIKNQFGEELKTVINIKGKSVEGAQDNNKNSNPLLFVYIIAGIAVVAISTTVTVIYVRKKGAKH